MENKKMTKAQAWNIVYGIVAESAHPQTAELLEKIENELMLLAKKNAKSASKPDTNAELKEHILANMVVGERYTIADMVKSFPLCAGLSNQKMSSVMRALMPDQVERTVEKGKVYFSKI